MTVVARFSSLLVTGLTCAFAMSPAAVSSTLRSTIDYPPESLAAGEQGTVVYAVEITEAGRAENCTVVASSGFPRLDAATCALVVDRMVFEPATEDDKPVRSTYSGKINWKLPD